MRIGGQRLRGPQKAQNDDDENWKQLIEHFASLTSRIFMATRGDYSPNCHWSGKQSNPCDTRKLVKPQVACLTSEFCFPRCNTYAQKVNSEYAHCAPYKATNNDDVPDSASKTSVDVCPQKAPHQRNVLYFNGTKPRSFPFGSNSYRQHVCGVLVPLCEEKYKLRAHL